MFLVAVDTRSPMPEAIYKVEDTGMAHPDIWGRSIEELENLIEGDSIAQTGEVVFKNDWKPAEKKMTAKELFDATRPDDEGGYKTADEVLGFRPDSAVFNLREGQLIYKTM